MKKWIVQLAVPAMLFAFTQSYAASVGDIDCSSVKAAAIAREDCYNKLNNCPERLKHDDGCHEKTYSCSCEQPKFPKQKGVSMEIAPKKPAPTTGRQY